jgi:HEPN domain-containing protein
MEHVNTDLIALPPATEPGIGLLITNITRLVPAEKLFLLSSAAAGYHLLALLPGNTPHTFREYQHSVQSACSEYGSVVLWCLHTGEAVKLLRAGHLFFSLHCTTNRLVYDTGRVPLPETRDINVTAIVEKARATFHRPFSMACSFLDGAKYYAATSQTKTAAFSLHQAAEPALRALLLAVMHYNGYGHDLRGLLRRYAYFVPPPERIFFNTAHDSALLQLLNNAYMHTRYKNNYAIGADELALLLHKVTALHRQVQQCFEKRVAMFEAFMLSG